MKVGEFFVDMGINATPGATTLKDFMGSMMGMRMSTLSAIGALGTVGTFLMGTADMASNAAVSFQKFNNQTGLSTTELQNWQRAAKMVNVDANTVANGIFGLQMRLAEFARGEGNPAPFQRLMIQPGNNAFEVLDALRERKAYIDPAQFTSLIGQLGLTPDWVNVLKLSNEEYKKFKETAHGMGPEMQSDVLKMTESWNRFYLKIRDVNLLLGRTTAGPVRQALDTITENMDSKDLASMTWSLLKAAGIALTIPARIITQLPYGGKAEPGVSTTTKHVAINVYGDTHDEKFAADVASMIDETEGQIPLTESTIR